MLWINKVILENFQSHRYTVLNFTEGLNAIIGPTDSGKTAVFRGIKWALFNEPKGDDFIRIGSNEASVQVEFNNGVIVKRYRTRSKNGYKLTYPDGEETTFEGFGNDVPLEIKEAIQMGNFNITGDSKKPINLAEQLDPPFLLSETSGTRAVAIGKLVEADVIDQALSDTNKDIRDKKQREKFLKENLESIDNELKEFEYLDKLKIKIESLKKIEKSIKEKKEKVENLKNLRNKLLERENEIKKSELIILKTKDLKDIKLISLNIQDKFNRSYNLKKINIDLLNNKKEQKIENNIADKLENLEKLFDKKETLEEDLGKYYSLIRLKGEITDLEKEKRLGEEIIEKAHSISKVFPIINEINNKKNLYEKLSSLNKGLKEFKERIKNGNEYLDKFKYLDQIKKIEETAKNKCNLVLDLKKKKLEIENYEKRINLEEKKKKNHETKIEKMTMEFDELLSELKICPTCFRPMDEHDIENIKAHLVN